MGIGGAKFANWVNLVEKSPGQYIEDALKEFVQCEQTKLDNVGGGFTINAKDIVLQVGAPAQRCNRTLFYSPT